MAESRAESLPVPDDDTFDNRRGIIINGRQCGRRHPVYIVAELSANHHQDFDEAVNVVKAARDAGADAIKLQTYSPDTMTINCDGDDFTIKGTIWEGRKLYDLYGEACTPWKWQPDLMDLAVELGLDFFSTPFDATAVDFLEGMGVPCYKVASFELVDLPLLRRVAATGKPVILSTGMASLGEIDEAVSTLRSEGCQDLALLKCTSAYPASPRDMNLCTIPHLADAFDVPVGLSDHTLGSDVAVAAVALGASIVEKHFTMSRSVPGPDSAFSMEPAEFGSMVASIRCVEQALGRVAYGAEVEEASSTVFRRSLYVVENMAANDVFTAANVRAIRPGYGLHTRHLDEVLGRRATRQISRGTRLAWELVGGDDDGA